MRYVTLKKASELLGCSYQYVYAHRYDLGFQLPNGKKWFVSLTKINELANPKPTHKDLLLCRYTNKKTRPIGTLISDSPMGLELENLLTPKARNRHKSYTTK